MSSTRRLPFRSTTRFGLPRSPSLTKEAPHRQSLSKATLDALDGGDVVKGCPSYRTTNDTESVSSSCATGSTYLGTQSHRSAEPFHAKKGGDDISTDASSFDGSLPSSCAVTGSSRANEVIARSLEEGRADAGDAVPLPIFSRISRQETKPVHCLLGVNMEFTWVDGQPKATPCVSVRLHPEGPPDDETRTESAKWAAHRAAFYNDHKTLQTLTVGWGADEWARLDCCGNTVLHVAVLRRSIHCVRFVVSTGHAIQTKNSIGWTALEEAVDLRDEVIARPIYDWVDMHAPKMPSKSALRDQALSALESMPDFTMKIKWRFGSPLFGWLVKQYAPSDTYTLWKRGNRLRIDGSLTGVDVENKVIPQWTRGHFSLLLAPEEPGGPSRVWLAHHSKRTIARPGRILKEMGAPTIREGDPIDERVTLACTVGAGGRVTCSLKAIGHVPVSVEDLKFESMLLKGVCDAKTEVRPDAATFKPVNDWLGKQQRETIAGVQTSVYEATARVRTTEVNKVNSYDIYGSFDKYVACRGRENSNQITSELLQIPVTYDDLMKSVGVRDRQHPSDDGSRLRAKLWLAKGFPLNVEHMQLMLDVIAHANGTARKMSAVLETWRERDVFPMKVHVPLLMTLYCQLLCSDYGPCTAKDAPDEWFDLPVDYEETDMKSTFEKLSRPVEDDTCDMNEYY